MRHVAGVLLAAAVASAAMAQQPRGQFTPSERNNGLDDRLAFLGQKLFFDSRLSGTGTTGVKRLAGSIPNECDTPFRCRRAVGVDGRPQYGTGQARCTRHATIWPRAVFTALGLRGPSQPRGEEGQVGPRN
jgi:hypothetical protein